MQYIGSLGNPRHSGSLYNTLTRFELRYNSIISYFGKVDDYDRFADCPLFHNRGTPARRIFEAPTTIYHTFSANRAFDSGFDVTLGVANAFDKKPPVTSTSSSIANVGNALLYSQYDQFGRR